MSYLPDRHYASKERRALGILGKAVDLDDRVGAYRTICAVHRKRAGEDALNDDAFTAVWIDLHQSSLLPTLDPEAWAEFVLRETGERH